jgi:hypothetical protein
MWLGWIMIGGEHWKDGQVVPAPVQRRTMSLIDDDTFIPDDDMLEEWLAQVFDVAGLKPRKEPTPGAGYRTTPRRIPRSLTLAHGSMIAPR